jgi:hypothetical protein
MRDGSESDGGSDSMTAWQRMPDTESDDDDHDDGIRVTTKAATITVRHACETTESDKGEGAVTLG